MKTIYETKEEAQKISMDTSRAFTSNALNRLIQGSAADQSKMAMVAAHKAGLDIRLPVHDEINIMVHKKEDINELKEIMINVIKLEVPVEVDISVGDSWC